jgi:GNAT superfamily N-acetyltransferase
LSIKYEVRPYRSGDEEEIVEFLQLAINGWPKFDLDCTPIDHWRWKYQNNFLKSKIITLALSDKRIIGSIHAIPLKTKIFDEIILCSLGGDVAVHPEFRRKGVRNHMDEVEARYILATSGIEYTYVITGNPIAIKMLNRDKKFNYFPVDAVNLARIQDIHLHLKKWPTDRPWLIKVGFYVLKIYNDLRNVISGYEPPRRDLNILEIDSFDSRIEDFWKKISKNYNFIMELSRNYLNWRYCDPRGGKFIVKQAEDDGQIVGYSVIRINNYREDYPVGYFVDLLTLPHRLDVTDALVADAVKYFDSQDVNFVTYLGIKNHPSETILKRHGFLNSRMKTNIFYKQMGLKYKLHNIITSPPSKVHLCYGYFDTI